LNEIPYVPWLNDMFFFYDFFGHPYVIHLTMAIHHPQITGWTIQPVEPNATPVNVDQYL
jgi:hypothetical protein